MKPRGGFSIVEVIVATAILLVLTVILSGLLIAGANFYRRHTATVAMQMQAQTVMAQIREMVEDSTQIGPLGDSNTLVAEREVSDSQTLRHTLVFIDGKIEYTYEELSADGTVTKEEKAILAEGVADLTPLTVFTTEQRMVTVTLKLEKLGRTWQETQIFARRNP